MFSKFLVFSFGAIGGTAPLFYIFRSGSHFNSEKISADNEKTAKQQMIWECKLRSFENLDLEHVTLNSSSVKLIHCYKESQYDWQIALPKFMFDSNKLDESNNLKLISEHREDNVSSLLVLNISSITTAQKKDIALDNWFLMKKINSHNIFKKIGYFNLFEFEITSPSQKVDKAWVIL